MEQKLDISTLKGTTFNNFANRISIDQNDRNKLFKVYENLEILYKQNINLNIVANIYLSLKNDGFALKSSHSKFISERNLENLYVFYLFFDQSGIDEDMIAFIFIKMIYVDNIGEYSDFVNSEINPELKKHLNKEGFSDDNVNTYFKYMKKILNIQ